MSNAMYESIVRKIDSVQEELGALALALHEHPELSFQEHFACQTLSDILEKHGYQVK